MCVILVGIPRSSLSLSSSGIRATSTFQMLVPAPSQIASSTGYCSSSCTQSRIAGISSRCTNSKYIARSNWKSAGAGTNSKTIQKAVESRELRFLHSPALPFTRDLGHTSTSIPNNPSIETNKGSKSRGNTPLVVTGGKPLETLPTNGTSAVMHAATASLFSSGENHNDRTNTKYSLSERQLSTGDNEIANTKNIISNRMKSGIPSIPLTKEESELFKLLAKVVSEKNMASTLRVAGGWVRDKLLSTEEFSRSSSLYSNQIIPTKKGRQNSAGNVERLTSKFKGPSMGRKGSKVIGSAITTLVDENDLPVDIDIALDDMLGREFADHLNEWLSTHGRKTVSVGVVLKNPERSKHLETATMKVGKFWIDFVNLRAEEYTEDSRIPDLMRIGTAEEDAYRRDLTINSLFYNINTRCIEDFTGKGLDDLKSGTVCTPLPPLTTLLDDPLRVLRSVRFAARLRFTMEKSLMDAAKDKRVHVALAQKVARERIGSEVDLMLRSQDPVGAMRLLNNLNLVNTVFPIEQILNTEMPNTKFSSKDIFEKGLKILSTTHDHLCDCKQNTPTWCDKKEVNQFLTNGVHEVVLMDDEETRRKLWYASFLKPLFDHENLFYHQIKAIRKGKKANRSIISKLLVDDLKRPVRDAEAVERIMRAADDFTKLVEDSGGDLYATTILLAEIRVVYHGGNDDSGTITCHMGQSSVNSETEDDPMWLYAMEFRLLVSKVLEKVGPLWRAALILSLSEHLSSIEDDDLSYTIEGDVFQETRLEMREGVIQKYDTFAASLLRLGLIGIWSQQPLINGKELISQSILPNIPKGPAFRDVMDEQTNWIISHPGGSKEALISHMQMSYPEFC
eukprot:CAMPEP_0184867300 /NCGR_PEP_ID=MMETSP0580-20130426/25894_1 /TAXON_ID=1118495 /ORGANISM="Dactyliosolen fragilissimus" /LENGTH=848 /DNA_ID=CAMNT_0027367493 /DNA_START=275 /DNA_END=2821 /DNA_ORIENTATION=+